MANEARVMEYARPGVMVGSMGSNQSAVNKNYEIYYSGKYWNDYELVQEYINKKFTADVKATFENFD